MPTAPKAVVHGTHRACRPEETWARIRPLLGGAGITRLADVTRLDSIGIPVWQAVRPASLNLSVSQGKGITPLLARVSAAMESLELWHAERIDGRVGRHSIGAMRGSLGYDVECLPLQDRHVLHDDVVVDWVGARLLDGAETAVPRDAVELDYRLRAEWAPPLFTRTSNGLASGNTMTEALLHALYELVERDALARVDRLARDRPRTDPASITDGDAAALLEQMARAGVAVTIHEVDSPAAIACFEVVIRSDAFPLPCRGAGCHLDREVALCRALTEAAQSRLTLIAGARDDLRAAEYADVADRWSLPLRVAAEAPAALRSYDDVATSSDADLEADLDTVAGRVRAAGGSAIVVVDLRRPGIDLPVARVLAPGLLTPAGM